MGVIANVQGIVIVNRPQLDFIIIKTVVEHLLGMHDCLPRRLYCLARNL